MQLLQRSFLFPLKLSQLLKRNYHLIQYQLHLLLAQEHRDVLEPEGDVIGIGSGGNYALAAGKVLMETEMNAEEVAKKAIKVAADICVFTNNNVKIEKI